LPCEQSLAQAVLQELDLIAHRGLRHPELGGGAGKTLVARRRLERPDGGQRRKLEYGRSIRRA